jgi:hypothetical protein
MRWDTRFLIAVLFSLKLGDSCIQGDMSIQIHEETFALVECSATHIITVSSKDSNSKSIYSNSYPYDWSITLGISVLTLLSLQLRVCHLPHLIFKYTDATC